MKCIMKALHVVQLPCYIIIHTQVIVKTFTQHNNNCMCFSYSTSLITVRCDQTPNSGL